MRPLPILLSLALLSLALPATTAAAPQSAIEARIDWSLLDPTGPQAALSWQRDVLLPAPDLLRVVVEVEPGANPPVAEVAQVELARDTLIQALVGRSDLKALAALPGVLRVRRPLLPLPRVVSEGVDAMNAGVLYDSGYDGTGVRVGILDSGFGGLDAVADELPALDEAHVSWSVAMGGPGTDPHGTACTEIVHDVAPGAELFLAGFATEVEYLEQLDWLIEQGVSVISASIGFDNVVPMDGTSLFAQAVDIVADSGVLYVGAAGNEGKKYWSGTWDDSDQDGSNDFDSSLYPNLVPLWLNGSTTDAATVPVMLRARWLESWGQSGVDLDLDVIMGPADNPGADPSVLASAVDAQDGDDLPVEAIELQGVAIPPGYGVFAHLRHVAGGSPEGLTIKLWHYGELYSEYQVLDGSLSAPADAEGCVAVGAVRWSDSTIPGYSSEGPTDDGRSKPDVYGPSHVSTASYGSWVSEEPGQEGFNGTSAATPHVAGAAALLISSGTYSTIDEVRRALVRGGDQSAIDGGSPSGAGLLQLDQAMGCGCSHAEPRRAALLSVLLVLALMRRRRC